jgi:GNAT superfamily N-acetyltransferase
MITEDSFLKHYEVDDWGHSVLIMERNGTAFARAYWYNDEPTTIYLDMLSVNSEVRKTGIGTKLQEIREQMGRDTNCTESWLWVRKDSWMHDWYKRRGYIDNVEKDEEHIWMKKSL